MKKRWFTLIEILVVIVIISILLALSLGFTGNRVQILVDKYIQEEFVSNYNTLFSRNFLTNYYRENIYENLVIQIKENEWWFSYYYKTGSEQNDIEKFSVEWGKSIISDLQFTWWTSIPSLTEVDIIFTPYTFWCVLSGASTTWKILDMIFMLNNDKKYCYQINSNLCRLEKIVCSE